MCNSFSLNNIGCFQHYYRSVNKSLKAKQVFGERGIYGFTTEFTKKEIE